MFLFLKKFLSPQDGTFFCQHGRKECDANRLHSCVLNSVDMKQALPFIVCFERVIQSNSVDDAFYQCSRHVHNAMNIIRFLSFRKLLRTILWPSKLWLNGLSEASANDEHWFECSIQRIFSIFTMRPTTYPKFCLRSIFVISVVL